MKIAIVDIETTGFLNQGGKIVEIGVVELDLSNGDINPLFDHVVHESGITKEEVETSWIVNNSSLTLEEVRHSQNLNNHREVLQEIFNTYYMTAYNKKFDFGFLRDRGFIIGKELDCPMQLLTPIMKLPSRGYGNYKYPKVIESYPYLFPEESDYDEEHRGCSDAIDEAKIVYELYKRGQFKIS